MFAYIIKQSFFDLCNTTQCRIDYLINTRYVFLFIKVPTWLSDA